jgi:Clostridium epsilon toxin ETX/Bacillus mosquitocidal toxin MTX2
LFDGADWNGFGNTFFLAEWPANTIHNLQGWTVCDAAASIYFGGLGVGAVTLYDGATGNDQSAGFSGWLRRADGSSILGANLVERGFEDRAASWKWAPLPPVYQVVDPFTVNGTFSIDDSLSGMFNQSGINTGNSTVQQTAKFIYMISQTATVTVTHTSTETYTETVGFTFGQSFGVANVAATTYEFALNVGFSEEFTETMTETDTTTQTLTSELDQLISVPANSSWTAKLLLQYGKVPPTSFTTTASYYSSSPCQARCWIR